MTYDQWKTDSGYSERNPKDDYCDSNRMTLLERLRNPAWVHAEESGEDRVLDTEATLKDMGEAAKILDGLDSRENHERAKRAYDIFRSGFGDQPCPAPTWEEAEPWIRDIVKVAYFQGSLDRKQR